MDPNPKTTKDPPHSMEAEPAAEDDYNDLTKELMEDKALKDHNRNEDMVESKDEMEVHDIKGSDKRMREETPASPSRSKEPTPKKPNGQPSPDRSNL